ncbi:MAG TPA: S9 family peptidase [Alphaproteobacteria bacterium]|nr:S9 family peptidase [Alphaproteobacteria bacterium]
MKLMVVALIGSMTLVSAAVQAAEPPLAEKRPFMVTSPNGAREDDYYWLRDDTRKDSKMLAYLAAENAYTDTAMAPAKVLKDALYGEFVGRVKQDDSSVPYFKHGYWYYTRYETGADYPIVGRRKGSMTAPETVMLDEAKMAEGHGYFAINDWTVSPDNTLLAYAEDTVGRRQYVLKIKNLETGETLADAVQDVEPNLVWAADNKTIFYVEKDPVTLLSTRIKAHVVGTPATADRLVYKEKDTSFYIGLKKTRSEKFICIVEHSTESNEVRCAPSANPVEFAVVAPREREVRYDIDHFEGRWVIRTDWNAKNYRLMTLPDSAKLGDRSAWKDLVPGSDTVFIQDFALFPGGLATEERSDGLKRLHIRPDKGESRFVKADEPAYAMSLIEAGDPDTGWLRYSYDSLTTPTTTYETNLMTGERRLLKTQPVIGYSQENYVTERVWVTARDGVKVPVSLVYKKGFKKDGTAAMLQYAYGSYGMSTDPRLSLPNVSLLDRGMVYAIAHIRGGQEMGRAWYDDGRLLNKKHTFTDFIDVTRALVKMGYAAKDRVAAQGGSAGGLLMGAVANMAPEDYRVMIAQVPFVDVVTTMLDESIPLTTNEFDEWGNPKQKNFYDYMLSYSPYDNVAKKPYPALFVSTGLWDSQVQYYEPAKWVAKLRATKTDRNPLVFRINMEAGHGGKSGRFRRFQEAAEYDAFMLTELGITQ